MKTSIVVAQRLFDPPRILIAFASHDGSNKLVVIELLDVRARLTLFATTIRWSENALGFCVCGLVHLRLGSKYECSDSVSAGMSAVVQGMQ